MLLNDTLQQLKSSNNTMNKKTQSINHTFNVFNVDRMVEEELVDPVNIYLSYIFMYMSFWVIISYMGL